MTISPDEALPAVAEPPRKARPGRELAAEAYQAAAWPLVLCLQRLRVPPPAVLLTHAAIGLTAALAVATEAFVAAALLLQVKTLLDNTDGQLARATGRVSALGRYLDTELDLLVNLAVFAALGMALDAPWLAAAGFAAVTLILSVDHNLVVLYEEARGRGIASLRGGGTGLERALESIYRALFAPQDRIIRAFSERRLGRVVGNGEPDDGARRAYNDRATVTVLANLGLSTQLLALGICLVLGASDVYLWIALACLALLPILQLRRERLARRAAA